MTPEEVAAIRAFYNPTLYDLLVAKSIEERAQRTAETRPKISDGEGTAA